MLSVVPPVFDTALLCLVALCRFHQIPVEPAQIAREYGGSGEPLSSTDLQRAAKALGLKCRHVLPSQKSQLPDAAILPALFRTHTGDWLIIARRDTENSKLLIHDLRQPQPQVVTETEFSELWNGELLLMRKNRGQTMISTGNRALTPDFLSFDIRWFIPALVKYKKLFGEVLLASFFCNCLLWPPRCFFRW